MPHTSARLAGFYFFYYATVGAYMPYWSPYLEHRGFSTAQMGVVYALMGVLRAIVPLVWGWWADHSQSRMRLVRTACVGALVIFAWIPFQQDWHWIAALMLAYTLFWHAILSQFEVVALAHLQGKDYSKVRLWGSVGFVVAVLALGAVLDHTGLDYAPAGIALFWLGMAVAAFLVHDAPAPRQKHTDAASLLSVLKQPTLLALLLACFCSQASFTPYYNFFTLFLEQHGHSRSVAGVLWALGVVAEVALFAVMAKVMLKVGTRRLMEWALLITALRWFLTAWLADSLLGLVLLQLSHALSFGAYHACAMHYVQSHFPSHLQGRGQAIYNAVAYGVGGSVGSLVVGYLWTAWSPEATFVLAGIVAAVGFLVFRQTFRKHAHPI